MSIDKMREDFEKFRDERNATLEREGHKPGSKWHVTNAHYATWHASRESLVVELPKRCDKMDGIAVYAEEGDFYHRHDIREAIEAAGVKVAP